MVQNRHVLRTTQHLLKFLDSRLIFFETRKKPSLEVASNTLLVIYSFQFRSVFFQPSSASAVTVFFNFTFTVQSKRKSVHPVIVNFDL